MNIENPFLQENELEFNAIPFDKIKPEHFIPALKKSIEMKEKEILEITENKEEPTFENTILKYELSGKLFEMISQIFNIIYSAKATDDIKKVSHDIESLIIKGSNKDFLNKELFQKIKNVYDKKDSLKLPKDDLSLIKRTYQIFLKEGANCPESSKKRLEEIKIRLGKLYLKFSENLQKESKEFYFVIKNEEDIIDMPEDGKNAAREIAEKNKKEGFMFLPNRSMIPLIFGYCKNRKLREEFFMKQRKICCSGGETDNQDLVLEISNLRLEIAKIFGKESYGEIPIRFNMINKVKDVEKIISDIFERSLPIAKKEVLEISNFSKLKEGENFELMPWDFIYYSELYKKEKFNLDETKVKEYFELEKTLDAIFNLTKKAYDLDYKKIENLPAYNEDVLIYEVLKNNEHYGLIYFDLYSRTGEKSDGAWMNEITPQFNYPFKQRPHIHMCANFNKPKKGEKTLLTQDEVETILHEFGHVLHGILSNVKYSSNGGTWVPRDFVELPSQVMEGFFFEKDFLKNCAFHYKTGEFLPEDYFLKMLKLKNFQKGYWYVRQMGLCMIDNYWNTIKEISNINVIKKEEEILSKIKLFPKEILRYRTVSFLHPFGHGYEMNYHSYSYSEILDSGMFKFLKKNNFSEEAFQSFEKEILSKGNTINYLEAYKKVTGREPNISSLFERSGI